MLSGHGTGNELFTRRQLHLLVWQFTLGCALVRGCRIVLVGCQFRSVPPVHRSWCRREAGSGLIQTGHLPLPGQAALFSLWNPLFLVTECSVVTCPCTCLLRTRKNEQREGVRKYLTSKILLYHANFSLCNGTDLKTCEAQLTTFKMLPSINS